MTIHDSSTAVGSAFLKPTAKPLLHDSLISRCDKLFKYKVVKEKQTYSSRKNHVLLQLNFEQIIEINIQFPIHFYE